MRIRTAVGLLLCTAAMVRPAIVTLQQGLDGYGGCMDKELRDPNRNFNVHGPYNDQFWVIEY